MIRMQAGTYELVEENRNGWNPETFKERYSDVLDKYDYIVGDWGYGQLRLRGFYENSNRKVPFEQKIATLDEYLQEFCNFGCPYFVLRRTKLPHKGEVGDGMENDEQTYLDLDVVTPPHRHESSQRYARPQAEERKERDKRPYRNREQRLGHERSGREQRRPYAGKPREKVPTNGEKRNADRKPDRT